MHGEDVELSERPVGVVEEDVEEERGEGEEGLPRRLRPEEHQEEQREGDDVHRGQADQEAVPANGISVLFMREKIDRTYMQVSLQ